LLRAEAGEVGWTQSRAERSQPVEQLLPDLPFVEGSRSAGRQGSERVGEGREPEPFARPQRRAAVVEDGAHAGIGLDVLRGVGDRSSERGRYRKAGLRMRDRGCQQLRPGACRSRGVQLLPAGDDAGTVIDSTPESGMRSLRPAS
jgi:hypothetical protein